MKRSVNRIILRKDQWIMSEKLQVLLECYNQNDFRALEPHLANECHYESQWVFEALVGKRKIMEYLLAKAETIAKYNAFPVAKHARILSPYRDKECILLYQGDLHAPACIVIIEEKANTITRIDICIPELFKYELI